MKKYTMEVDYEVADNIFLHVLKDDYIVLNKEIARIKASQEGRLLADYPPHIREDYEANYDYVVAMEKLFRYYMTREEAVLLERQGIDIRYGKTA